jgi:hypothetical protein
MIKGLKAGYVPMETFPLATDPIPAGYTGWLILLDEINSAAQAVQAGSYKLVLDRMIGQHELHPKAVIACAGNLATSGAIVNRQGTAMQTRMVHYELAVDWKLWSLWASSNHLATEIISYINHVPSKLMNFDPNHEDRTFSCPRTWEFSSRILSHKGMTREEKLPSLAGCLGEAIAFEFITYCDVYKHIPSYDNIKANPKTISITDEPMMLAALSGMVGSHLTIPDIPNVMKYIHRLPMEFQVFALRDAVKRTPKMMQETEISEWLTINGDILA